MTKTFKTLSVILVTTGLFFFIGCKKSGGPGGGVGCSQSAQTYIDAAKAYSDNPTTANCEKMRRSAINLLEKCPSFYTGEQKETIEELKNASCE